MTRHLLPLGRSASGSTPSITGRGFQLTLLSAAVALSLGLAARDAQALALGRMNVLSALGEPLRAQIDVTEISAAEAEGLRVGIASQDAFRQAGVPYNAALADVRVQLSRGADGRYVVNLTGSRSMNDPFIDLLLDATWSAGRIVRDYTVLLDPPATRTASAAVTPQPAQVPAAPPRRATAAAPVVVAPPAARRVRPIESAAAPAPAPAPEAPVRTGSGTPAGSGEQVTVRPGDTASKIAGTYKPADVSLDQMLVALLRANPDAFIRGNVNRMRSGAVLDLPSAAQAGSMTPSEATRSVRAQSQDFGSYRRRLAENAPASQTATAERQASGRLQASVEERSAAATSPDKLKLSQGAAATEDRLAQTRQAQATNSRVAELSKNLSDLNRLQAASSSVAAATTGSPASNSPAATRPTLPAGTGSAVPAPSTTSVTPPVASPPPAAPPVTAAPTTPATAAVAPAAAPAANPPTPTPAAATTTATPAAASTGAAAALSAASAASVPAAVGAAASGTAAAPGTAASASARAPVTRPATPPAPVPERGFLDDVLANPLLLAAGAIIAALLAFLLVRVLRRRRVDSPDSVFLESKMPRDSFFGVSGGQQVDTTDRTSSVASSLSYSPSQLDTGDVDPVAEADVYLAYGRDLQAEEILREAMRTNPERAAIPLKLLEIHAKRRDARAFEALATDLQKLTGGTGSEWLRAVELGRELDPGNPLYQTGVGDIATAVPPAATKPAGTVPVAMPVAAPIEPVAPPPAFVPSVAPLDFDLELSRPSPLAAPVSASLPPSTPPAPMSRPPIEPVTSFATTMSEAPRTTMEPTLDGGPRLPVDSRSMDFDSESDTSPAPLEPTTRAGLLSEERTRPATLHGNLAKESGFIEFDMSSLSQRDVLPDQCPAPLDDGGEDAHAIKLSLARELQALGDNEGARSLVDEVEAEASGEVKERARQLRAQLA
ncbi:MAG: hypothetical protein EOO22_02010 [Comamonadaceae bacterium]|nr:MAG: hypothetical protein EOO22_02010 [Comamonadaceae bacterium]